MISKIKYYIKNVYTHTVYSILPNNTVNLRIIKKSLNNKSGTDLGLGSGNPVNYQ